MSSLYVTDVFIILYIYIFIYLSIYNHIPSITTFPLITTIELRACDVEKHIEDCTQGHLMLSTKRIIEQQDVIIQLNSSLKEQQKMRIQTDSKVEDLEKNIKNLELKNIEINTTNYRCNPCYKEVY